MTWQRALCYSEYIVLIHSVGRRALAVISGALACVLLGGVSSAWAVPIDISSGFVSLAGISDFPQYLLLGQSFQHDGSGGDTGNVGATSCNPCMAGDSVGMSSSLAGSTLAGHTNLNGTDYNIPAIDRSGVFSFTANPFLIPDSNLDVLTLIEPFTFFGTLFLPNSVNVSLAGQGMATLTLTGSQTNVGRLFSFDSVSYDFTAAATTPEPGTMLFLGSGSLAIAFLHSRRRRSRAS